MRVTIQVDLAERVVLILKTVGFTGDGDEIVGDFELAVHPGESIGDLSYDDLVAMGDGEHDIPDPSIHLA